MPEFILDLGSHETHKTYDALPSFIQGYLEAAFFCGIYFENDEISSLGLDNLDPSALEGSIADCVRFMRANWETLTRVTSTGSYEMDDAGRDYWFTRNGHGTGYWDRNLGDDGEALSEACRYTEIDFFAVPLDPDTKQPLPGHHVDFNELSDAEPDPEDPELWRVFLLVDPDPLTPEEQEWLETQKQPGPDLTLVGSRYGAPTGRGSYEGEAVTARRVTLDPGGYDAGGAYWGVGEPLWRLLDKEGETVGYQRAISLQVLFPEHSTS